MIATAGFHPVDWLLLAVIVVLLVFSGLLALAETSLVRTTRVKAKSLLDEHRRGARQLARLVDHPERFLNPVLLLVLVCQLVSATLVGVLASAWLGALGIAVGTVFEVVVIFVLFEAVPKNWAVHHPERAALFTAPIVDALVRFPVVRAASWVLVGTANLLIGRRGEERPSGHVTESELLAMADVAHAEDVIELQERTFIHSIIDFGDAVGREVMVPRLDIVAIEATATADEALERALEAGRSRLPVHEGDLDDVVGIAYVKDLVQAEHAGHGGDPVRAHTKSAQFVPETKHLTALMREMQDHKFHMAIVVDEYGSTVGLVTLEDLIEELVGEIVDEYDVEEPVVERLDDGSVVVAGRMVIDEAGELMGTELPEGGWDTVGGLMLARFGHVPAEGEAVDVDGLQLVAQRVQGRRISRVRIVRTAPAVTADGED